MSEPNEKINPLLERIRSRRPPLQKVELESLGTVYLRKPTGADQQRIARLRKELSTHQLETLPTSVFAAAMGAVLLRQENGELQFEDANEGFNELNAIAGDDLLELHAQIMRICGLDGNGKKLVEAAEKKSLSSQTSEPGTN